MRIAERRFFVPNTTRMMALAVSVLMAGCVATKPADVADSRVGVALRVARATRASGDIAAAAPMYRQAAADPSASPQALVEAGDGLLEAGLSSEAIEVYARVKSGSARLGALLGLARAHLALGEADQALQSAEQAVAFAPRDARPLVDKGVALDTLQRHTEAQLAYRAALQITPGSISARNDLALSLALSDQYDQGIALLEPLARAPSAVPKTRQNLALIYGLSGDRARAVALSRMDLDADKTDANQAFFARVRTGTP
jgi:Flp pilus assembly protein TadD